MLVAWHTGITRDNAIRHSIDRALHVEVVAAQAVGSNTIWYDLCIEAGELRLGILLGAVRSQLKHASIHVEYL